MPIQEIYKLFKEKIWNIVHTGFFSSQKEPISAKENQMFQLILMVQLSVCLD